MEGVFTGYSLIMCFILFLFARHSSKVFVSLFKLVNQNNNLS